MTERFISYGRLPMQSLWDGSPIRRTLNCDDCKFLVASRKGRRSLEVCAWGVAWKILSETEKPRKCLKIDKKPPEYNSLEAIEKLI